MKLSTTILIPNFNGLHLLQKHLPTVVEHSHNSQVLIVDDTSTDQSVAWISQNFPQITIFQNQFNQGFARSVNTGFKAIDTQLVLLLNNDVSLTKNTIPNLLKHFSNPKTFAVGCTEILPTGKKRGRSQGYFSRGLIMHIQASDLSSQGPTFWVFGASGMFNREIWQNLGGLDEIYAPAYWEDIDISYRAWKAGYQCLFDPSAEVYHDSEITMNSTLGDKKTTIAFRNQLLFFWKNIRTPQMWLSHIFWLPYHLIITSQKTKGAFLKGFFSALTRFPYALNYTPKPPAKLSDSQIITKSS
jgi:GT2 family glycosyltransferase